MLSIKNSSDKWFITERSGIIPIWEIILLPHNMYKYFEDKYEAIMIA